MLITIPRQDLCLAYANTRFWRGRETPTETLHTLSDLFGWLETSAGIRPWALRQLAARSCAGPADAARLLGSATTLREAQYRIFSALATDRRVVQKDFAVLQHALAAAPVRSQLVSSASGYAWEIESSLTSVTDLLAPVLWSAGDLITASARHRIRRCANDACLWLFLDESKNASRRWCDMAACGNRAKARRHYLKMTRG
jgi:predicted RNA-binding Zn ribbon-like protein